MVEGSPLYGGFFGAARSHRANMTKLGTAGVEVRSGGREGEHRPRGAFQTRGPEFGLVCASPEVAVMGPARFLAQ